ncbi:hypothetical protein BGZ59_002617, partial [Podila verticillata]
MLYSIDNDEEGEEDAVLQYSMSVQIICDMDKRIIGVHAGCTGQVHDATVFKRMAVYAYPNSHFSEREYLLSDSAYQLTMNCIPAYRTSTLAIERNELFNTCIAKAR